MVSKSLGVSFDVILLECAFEITLFQLGLSRVVTWPGSRFEKERIYGSKLFGAHPLHDVLRSYAQLTQTIHSDYKNSFCR